MADVTLTLGDIEFYDFEVPQEIGFGGQQHLVVHEQPGGGRIVDAMGPQEADISWSGHFRGDDAESRALTLDAMRQEGQVLPLAWSSNYRQVIIKEFKPVFKQPYEIPYHITCLVIPDSQDTGDAGGGADAAALPGAIMSDANVASAMLGDLNLGGQGLGELSAVSAAVEGLQGSLAEVGSLAQASASDLAGLTASLGQAQSAIGAAIAATVAPLIAAGSLVGGLAGLSPAMAAATLQAQAQAAQNLSRLLNAQAYVDRLGTNLAALPAATGAQG